MFVKLHALLKRIVDNHYIRLVMSALIVFSLLPHKNVSYYNIAFAVIFGAEFVLRVLLLSFNSKKGVSLKELLLLLLDFAAVLSFIFASIAPARLGRIARLVRLLYLSRIVGQTIKDFISIAKRRWYEVKLIVLTILIATLVSTVVMSAFDFKFDFDGSGEEHVTEKTFTKVLWWSFRQMEDTGNLVKRSPTKDSPIFLISLFLTLVGVMMMSFIIGIGNYLISEIIHHRKNGYVSFKNHLLVIIPKIRTLSLIERSVAMYEKNKDSTLWEQLIFLFKRQKFVLVSTTLDFPSYLYSKKFSTVEYRGGNVTDTQLLEKTNIPSARKIVVASNDLIGESADAHTLSTLLAIRSINKSERRLSEQSPHQKIFAEILYSQNAEAAAYAGGGMARCGNPAKGNKKGDPCICPNPIGGWTNQNKTLFNSSDNKSITYKCAYKEKAGAFCKHVTAYAKVCVPVEQGKFMGLLTSSTLLFPGLETAFDDLFTESGSEIYYEEMKQSKSLDIKKLFEEFSEINRKVYFDHHAILIGVIFNDGTIAMNLQEHYHQKKADSFLNQGIAKLVLIAQGSKNAKNTTATIYDILQLQERIVNENIPDKLDGGMSDLVLDEHFSNISKVIIVGCRYFVPTMIVEMVNNIPQNHFEFQIISTDENTINRAVAIITKEFAIKTFKGSLTEEKSSSDTQKRRWKLQKESWEKENDVIISIEKFGTNTIMGQYIQNQKFNRLLLLANPLSPDPDAITILFLMNLVKEIKEKKMHVVAEIISEDKSKVLKESFFKQIEGGSGSVHFLPTDKLRANVMVQAAYFEEDFIHVYESLLSAEGVDLCKLEFAQPASELIKKTEITFYDILSYATEIKTRSNAERRSAHIIPIGVELHREDGEREMRINPEMSETFNLHELRYIYAIGEIDDIRLDKSFSLLESPHLSEKEI